VDDRQATARDDSRATLQALELSDGLREGVNREIIAALELPAGSAGLDLGCGVGTQALLLAAAVGPRGRVTGLDIEPALLQRARAKAAAAGLAERLTFTPGDSDDRLPFADGAFDWVWSADFLGYRPELPAEVCRVIRPGGRLLVLFWSAELLLPGYPLLEARLRATRGGLAPFDHDSDPAVHPLRGLARLRAAGLEDISAQTFAATVCGPLQPATRRAMLAVFAMRWPAAAAELSAADAALYRRLTAPDSPHCILDLPDYYGFFIYSLFQGRRPATALKA
jgi:demethylmenaquinone methyltransferase/2-methoxy-6-polyprenyl-1,4-benzoquinol methylase